MNTAISHQKNMRACTSMLFSLAAALAIMLAASGIALADDKPAIKGPPVPSLITGTPEEGFALAVKLSQKGVVFTQADAKVRSGLRGQYANDPNSLIAVSHVVAVHFQTVAAANNYWRK
ncbi:hexameric tyrosine-coordinated heme protein [Parapusillimonas granuli]|nr:hexameric tyrosine-coordinated heme protein [Parapusillimonas granuli]MBB5216684.1 hypothetical protein [Parapusillimonas granuli]MEB2400013.1 hexameric tyrosine-coordinated heme protein [Alcaligenaceae bacterium]